MQVYVPSDKEGVVKSMKGHDFERLSTYQESMILKNIGDKVVRAHDLTSFAAFVWLVGDEEDVMLDAKKARAEFKVEVEADEEEKKE